MVVKRRTGFLLAGTVLGASFLVAGTALADDADLQRQINTMQQQLQAMQDQLAQAKQQSHAVEQAVRNFPSETYNQAPPGVYSPGGPPPTMFSKALPTFADTIHTTMAGSFVALEGAWREHNEVADGASSPPFGNPGIPLQNSVLWNEREFRMSAQQSRIAFKAYGDITPRQHLQAYYEMDFLNAATDANNRESNSFTTRVRQVWASYDNDDYHFHFLGGQAWSLLTQSRVGIIPQYENIPLTIDAQYVVGFDWARNPQLRFVGDWDKIVWFGVSLEQPAAVFPGSSTGVTSSTLPAPPAPTVLNINNSCTGPSHLNSTTSCSNDIFPDVIEKVAFDPGWGHYEAVALQRWFTDDVGFTTLPNSWSQQVTMGWGGGGSFLAPVIPGYLDLQGSVLYGDGMGRYTSSQLPDVTIGPTGSLITVKELSFMLGAVAHPWTDIDVYAYAGEDRSYANAWTLGATQGGWGNQFFVNNGCATQSMATTTAGTFNTAPAGLVCTFDVKMAQELTVGFWNTVYRGELGRVVWGLEYEYVRLTAFPGAITAAGLPNAGLKPDNNIAMFSFRYYPFN
jgi:hypothetical protein